MATIVGGRIEWLGVKEGDRVEAGQVLMRLWHGDLDARLAINQAQLSTARQRVQEACTVADNAEREAARQAQLVKRGFVSASAEEKARTEARARRGLAALVARRGRCGAVLRRGVAGHAVNWHAEGSLGSLRGIRG